MTKEDVQDSVEENTSRPERMKKIKSNVEAQ